MKGVHRTTCIQAVVPLRVFLEKWFADGAPFEPPLSNRRNSKLFSFLATRYCSWTHFPVVRRRTTGGATLDGGLNVGSRIYYLLPIFPRGVPTLSRQPNLFAHENYQWAYSQMFSHPPHSKSPVRLARCCSVSWQPDTVLGRTSPSSGAEQPEVLD